SPRLRKLRSQRLRDSNLAFKRGCRTDRGILSGVKEESSNPSGAHSSDPADGQLLAQVYDQLRAIARARLSHESPGHSLQATELVHEAYLKLRDNLSARDADRGRFFYLAAEAMRQILIDHARTKGRAKRGGGAKRSAADVAELAADQNPDEILALDE